MNQITKENRQPDWWTEENDTAWNRVKLAMKRDWDQTKHDFGGDEPDTHQTAGNTARQAAGTETIPPRGESTYEDVEAARRFGFGARSKFRTEYRKWDEQLETRLRKDWYSIHPTRKWEQDRDAIRYGWDYDDEG